ncbi:hypothetical protein RUM43_009829 [Polyplax serrata]|uniref:Uncharacterized protein n=1 Tax=Polyplax serrata TaxID=468196 RepID=A0AAN8S6X2_POLSC
MSDKERLPDSNKKVGDPKKFEKVKEKPTVKSVVDFKLTSPVQEKSPEQVTDVKDQSNEALLAQPMKKSEKKTQAVKETCVKTVIQGSPGGEETKIRSTFQMETCSPSVGAHEDVKTSPLTPDSLFIAHEIKATFEQQQEKPTKESVVPSGMTPQKSADPKIAQHGKGGQRAKENGNITFEVKEFKQEPKEELNMSGELEKCHLKKGDKVREKKAPVDEQVAKDSPKDRKPIEELKTDKTQTRKEKEKPEKKVADKKQPEKTPTQPGVTGMDRTKKPVEPSGKDKKHQEATEKIPNIPLPDEEICQTLNETKQKDGSKIDHVLPCENVNKKHPEKDNEVPRDVLSHKHVSKRGKQLVEKTIKDTTIDKNKNEEDKQKETPERKKELAIQEKKPSDGLLAKPRKDERMNRKEIQEEKTIETLERDSDKNESGKRAKPEIKAKGGNNEIAEKKKGEEQQKKKSNEENNEQSEKDNNYYHSTDATVGKKYKEEHNKQRKTDQKSPIVGDGSEQKKEISVKDDKKKDDEKLDKKPTEIPVMREIQDEIKDKEPLEKEKEKGKKLLETITSSVGDRIREPWDNKPEKQCVSQPHGNNKETNKPIEKVELTSIIKHKDELKGNTKKEEAVSRIQNIKGDDLGLLKPTNPALPKQRRDTESSDDVQGEQKKSKRNRKKKNKRGKEQEQMDKPLENKEVILQELKEKEVQKKTGEPKKKEEKPQKTDQVKKPTLVAESLRIYSEDEPSRERPTTRPKEKSSSKSETTSFLTVGYGQDRSRSRSRSRSRDVIKVSVRGDLIPQEELDKIDRKMAEKKTKALAKAEEKRKSDVVPTMVVEKEVKIVVDEGKFKKEDRMQPTKPDQLKISEPKILLTTETNKTVIKVDESELNHNLPIIEQKQIQKEPTLPKEHKKGEKKPEDTKRNKKPEHKTVIIEKTDPAQNLDKDVAVDQRESVTIVTEIKGAIQKRPLKANEEQIDEKQNKIVTDKSMDKKGDTKKPKHQQKVSEGEVQKKKQEVAKPEDKASELTNEVNKIKEVVKESVLTIKSDTTTEEQEIKSKDDLKKLTEQQQKLQKNEKGKPEISESIQKDKHKGNNYVEVTQFITSEKSESVKHQEPKEKTSEQKESYEVEFEKLNDKKQSGKRNKKEHIKDEPKDGKPVVGVRVETKSILTETITKQKDVPKDSKKCHSELVPPEKGAVSKSEKEVTGTEATKPKKTEYPDDKKTEKQLQKDSKPFDKSSNDEIPKVTPEEKKLKDDQQKIPSLPADLSESSGDEGTSMRIRKPGKSVRVKTVTAHFSNSPEEMKNVSQIFLDAERTPPIDKYAGIRTITFTDVAELDQPIETPQKSQTISVVTVGGLDEPNVKEGKRKIEDPAESVVKQTELLKAVKEKADKPQNEKDTEGIKKSPTDKPKEKGAPEISEKPVEPGKKSKEKKSPELVDSTHQKKTSDNTEKPVDINIAELENQVKKPSEVDSKVYQKDGKSNGSVPLEEPKKSREKVEKNKKTQCEPQRASGKNISEPKSHEESENTELRTGKNKDKQTLHVCDEPKQKLTKENRTIKGAEEQNEKDDKAKDTKSLNSVSVLIDKKALLDTEKPRQKGGKPKDIKVCEKTPKSLESEGDMTISFIEAEKAYHNELSKVPVGQEEVSKATTDGTYKKDKSKEKLAEPSGKPHDKIPVEILEKRKDKKAQRGALNLEEKSEKFDDVKSQILNQKEVTQPKDKKTPDVVEELGEKPGCIDKRKDIKHNDAQQKTYEKVEKQKDKTSAVVLEKQKEKGDFPLDRGGLVKKEKQPTKECKTEEKNTLEKTDETEKPEHKKVSEVGQKPQLKEGKSKNKKDLETITKPDEKDKSSLVATKTKQPSDDDKKEQPSLVETPMQMTQQPTRKTVDITLSFIEAEKNHHQKENTEKPSVAQLEDTKPPAQQQKSETHKIKEEKAEKSDKSKDNATQKQEKPVKPDKSSEVPDKFAEIPKNSEILEKINPKVDKRKRQKSPLSVDKSNHEKSPNTKKISEKVPEVVAFMEGEDTHQKEQPQEKVGDENVEKFPEKDSEKVERRKEENIKTSQQKADKVKEKKARESTDTLFVLKAPENVDKFEKHKVKKNIEPVDELQNEKIQVREISQGEADTPKVTTAEEAVTTGKEKIERSKGKKGEESLDNSINKRVPESKGKPREPSQTDDMPGKGTSKQKDKISQGIKEVAQEKIDKSVDKASPGVVEKSQEKADKRKEKGKDKKEKVKDKKADQTLESQKVSSTTFILQERPKEVKGLPAINTKLELLEAEDKKEISKDNSIEETSAKVNEIESDTSGKKSKNKAEEKSPAEEKAPKQKKENENPKGKQPESGDDTKSIDKQRNLKEYAVNIEEKQSEIKPERRLEAGDRLDGQEKNIPADENETKPRDLKHSEAMIREPKKPEENSSLTQMKPIIEVEHRDKPKEIADKKTHSRQPETQDKEILKLVSDQTPELSKGLSKKVPTEFYEEIRVPSEVTWSYPNSTREKRMGMRSEEKPGVVKVITSGTTINCQAQDKSPKKEEYDDGKTSDIKEPVERRLSVSEMIKKLETDKGNATADKPADSDASENVIFGSVKERHRGPRKIIDLQAKERNVEEPSKEVDGTKRITPAINLSSKLYANLWPEYVIYKDAERVWEERKTSKPKTVQIEQKQSKEFQPSAPPLDIFDSKTYVIKPPTTWDGVKTQSNPPVLQVTQDIPIFEIVEAPSEVSEKPGSGGGGLLGAPPLRRGRSRSRSRTRCKKESPEKSNLTLEVGTPRGRSRSRSRGDVVKVSVRGDLVPMDVLKQIADKEATKAEKKAKEKQQKMELAPVQRPKEPVKPENVNKVSEEPKFTDQKVSVAQPKMKKKTEKDSQEKRVEKTAVVTQEISHSLSTCTPDGKESEAKDKKPKKAKEPDEKKLEEPTEVKLIPTEEKDSKQRAEAKEKSPKPEELKTIPVHLSPAKDIKPESKKDSPPVVRNRTPKVIEDSLESPKASASSNDINYVKSSESKEPKHPVGDLPSNLNKDETFWSDKWQYNDAENAHRANQRGTKSKPEVEKYIRPDDKDGDSDRKKDGSGGGYSGWRAPPKDSNTPDRKEETQKFSHPLPGGVGGWTAENTYLSKSPDETPRPSWRVEKLNKPVSETPSTTAMVKERTPVPDDKQQTKGSTLVTVAKVGAICIIGASLWVAIGKLRNAF